MRAWLLKSDIIMRFRPKPFTIEAAGSMRHVYCRQTVEQAPCVTGTRGSPPQPRMFRHGIRRRELRKFNDARRDRAGKGGACWSSPSTSIGRGIQSRARSPHRVFKDCLPVPFSDAVLVLGSWLFTLPLREFSGIRRSPNTVIYGLRSQQCNDRLGQAFHSTRQNIAAEPLVVI